MRFSLAGVQFKFSASGDPKRGLTIPVGGMGSHWIVKLPDRRYARVPENEFSMMTFAREAGIDVPEVGLVDPSQIVGMPDDLGSLSGQAYYIRRFDRMVDGGRIHTEDFAQLNSLFPHQKYDFFNFDRLAEQLADIVSLDAAIEVVRRIVFTIGIGNGDMHVKNWSVIYRDGRTPSLAPAYDYVSTIVYSGGDDLGMNFAGTKRFTDIDDAFIERFARFARLPQRPVLDAAHDMVARMREVWPKLRRSLPISADHRKRIEAHMDTVPLFGGAKAISPIRERASRP